MVSPSRFLLHRKPRTAAQILGRGVARIGIERKLEVNKSYRIVEEQYSRLNSVIGVVKEINSNNKFLYRLEKNAQIGDIVKKIDRVDITQGLEVNKNDEVRLRDLKVGDQVFSIDGRYCLSGGSYGIIKNKDPKIGKAKILLRSGTIIDCSLDKFARLGIMSCKAKLETRKVAGRQRRLGIRPRVSRNAKNAYDR